MAKKKDSEKHEDGQKGKYNKDDADVDLDNFVDDITDEGIVDEMHCTIFTATSPLTFFCIYVSRVTR